MATQGTIVIEADAPSSPALARADQVDAAVRLENATAQSATAGNAASPAAHAAGGVVQHQPAIGSVLPSTDASGAALSQLPAQHVDEKAFSGHVVRGLATMVNQRGGVMNMRLDPPELGALRVQMTLTRGVVSAEFQASTPQAQGLLERNLTVLRSALEGQGLTVDRLTVHISPASGQQSMRDDGNTNSSGQWQRHNHDAAGGESRGRRDGHPHDQPRRFSDAEFTRFFDASETFDQHASLAATT